MNGIGHEVIQDQGHQVRFPLRNDGRINRLLDEFDTGFAPAGSGPGRHQFRQFRERDFIARAGLLILQQPDHFRDHLTHLLGAGNRFQPLGITAPLIAAVRHVTLQAHERILEPVD